MIDTLVTQIKQKINICRLYSISIGKSAQEIQLMIENENGNYVQRIMNGLMSLEEYKYFKERFFIQSLQIKDIESHMYGMIALVLCLESCLLATTQSLADYFTSEEITLIESFRKKATFDTVVDKDRTIVIKDDETHSLVLKSAFENAEAEYNRFLQK